ncbi:hypothetical protein [uncultured Bacteroides sp.]|uniref:hypothetical protein n=1 Tax=uncultured Bacteroides sp. TaxID=162156 RepID=UPI002AAA9FBD|nr:hypothetical protein [uncultured Bacteroides sp.]
MANKILITEDNITTIKERLEKLHLTFSLDESEDEFSIGDSEIYIEFPEEDEYMVYSIADFLAYTENIDSIVKLNDSTVRSSRIVQTIININDFLFDSAGIKNNVVENENFTISLCSNPFLIGLIATKERIFDEDYGITPCSMYTVVEIIYKDETSVLNIPTETKYIKEFLFYLSHKYSTPISIGEFMTDGFRTDGTIDIEDISTDGKKIENTKISINNLLTYSNLMDMYVDAMSIGNKEIKFLYYYKIIEHCSPIVSKMKAYELLNRKLDLLPYNNRDYKYLDSIFELTREYDISLRDSELAYTVLLECIDIIQLYEFLPESIKRALSRKYKYENKNIKYDLELSKQNSIKHGISLILYATRNSIVHAKSNYSLTGDECNVDDLEDLNVFISKLCYCLIAWNNRQSETYRLK